MEGPNVGTAVRRTLAIGGLLALAAPLIVLVPSTAEPAYALPGDQGIGWQYHEESGSYYQDPESSPGNPGPARRPTRYVDWGPGDMGLYQCPPEYDGSPFECTGDNPVGTFCNDLPGENGLPVAPRVIFEREFDNPAQTGNPPWRPLPPEDGDAEHATPYCQELPEDHVVTREEVEEVNVSIFQDLKGLDIQVHPDQNNRTLVNLSTIVSTTYPENIVPIPELQEVDADRQPKPYIRLGGHVDGKVQPFTYTIEAYADINWEFQRGTPARGHGRGHSFDGTLPEDAPAGYYVTTQFTKAVPSDISLSAVWTGTVTVNAPGQGPEEMPEVTVGPLTRQVQVAEAKSVIVD